MKKVAKKYSNKGITLITLVVTIIVLIILAGVSINLILGKNGIITIAKQAKENTELAKIEEETKLNELYMQIEAEGISSGDTSYDAITKLVEFKREIASAISDMGITTSEDADASTMSSNIRSISGASSADKVSYDNTDSGLTATNVQGAVDELNSSLSEISSSSNRVPISLSFNSDLNITMVSQNALFYKNGVYYIDVLIQTKNSASANTGIFSIVKEANVIHINRRLDALLEGTSTNYFIFKTVASDTLAVNGTTIPAGVYKLKMTIEELV